MNLLHIQWFIIHCFIDYISCFDGYQQVFSAYTEYDLRFFYFCIVYRNKKIRRLIKLKLSLHIQFLFAIIHFGYDNDNHYQ